MFSKYRVHNLVICTTLPTCSHFFSVGNIEKQCAFQYLPGCFVSCSFKSARIQKKKKPHMIECSEHLQANKLTVNACGQSKQRNAKYICAQLNQPFWHVLFADDDAKQNIKLYIPTQALTTLSIVKPLLHSH